MEDKEKLLWGKQKQKNMQWNPTTSLYLCLWKKMNNITEFLSRRPVRISCLQWVTANAGTHTCSKFWEWVTVECYAQMGHLCHPLPSLQSIIKREGAEHKCESIGRSTVGCCLLYMAWPMHSHAHSNYGYLTCRRWACQHCIMDERVLVLLC